MLQIVRELVRIVTGTYPRGDETLEETFAWLQHVSPLDVSDGS